MKKKVSELVDAQLDYAVAKACDREYQSEIPTFSTDWSKGGPIIEQENICIDAPYLSIKSWLAYKMELDAEGLPCWANTGPTLLVAAMRCFVESKLGEEIEILIN